MSACITTRGEFPGPGLLSHPFLESGPEEMDHNEQEV
jgi:hypothetical protein